MRIWQKPHPIALLLQQLAGSHQNYEEGSVGSLLPTPGRATKGKNHKSYVQTMHDGGPIQGETAQVLEQLTPETEDFACKRASFALFLTKNRYLPESS